MRQLVIKVLNIVFVLWHGEGRRINHLGEKIGLFQGCYWRNIVAGGCTVAEGLPTEQPIGDRFQLLKPAFRYQLSPTAINRDTGCWSPPGGVL